MKAGGKVKVKENLPKVMRELGFDENCIKIFCRQFVNTTQEIFQIWHNGESNTDFATVDLCCEIPLQCLEVIEQAATEK